MGLHPVEVLAFLSEQGAWTYLIRPAIANGHIGEALAGYHYSSTAPRKRTPQSIIEAWQSILNFVLEDHKLNATLLLSQYLLFKSRGLDQLQALERTTVNGLLAAGADILLHVMNFVGRIMSDGIATISMFPVLYDGVTGNL
ncbi:hypothetical protein BBP40_003925 [Aspergillus hancockii]|nr:hypothetical protein BBP40_003925 [Aspergillus hancockii]